MTDNNARLEINNELFRKVSCNCWNINKRIEECKESKVDIQVLSIIPVLFSYWSKPKDCENLCKFINNSFNEIVINYPKKFIVLGTIPMQDTELAIKEMDRCINELNFPGIQIGTNVNGENLYEYRFLPIFKHAERIGCSIFIHPWEMMGTADISKYWMPWLVGMPAETTRAICSLIFGGVLEKYPSLKIAFSHGGGSFPFTIGRINHGFQSRPDLCATDSSILPSEYIGKFYIDSLVHDKSTLEFLINLMGVEKIALGTDYPFPLGEHIPGKLIESLDISASKKQRILSGTALEWLGLNEKKYI